MPTCERCGNAYPPLALTDGICRSCDDEKKRRSRSPRSPGGERATLDEVAKKVLLTTETAPNLPIAERLEIITAECVMGVNWLKDFAAAFRDTAGGRSVAYQQELRDARKIALKELKREAFDLGANAVVGVNLAYSEISGGGKSMLFLVASGTAVRLAEDAG